MSPRNNLLLENVIVLLVAISSFFYLPSLSAEEIRKTPLVLRQGGTADKPEVFDGQGMIIDLGVDISQIEWMKTGDLWISVQPVAELPPKKDVQRAGLFLGDYPLRIVRDREAEKSTGEIEYIEKSILQPGQMGWAENGSVYFRWPSEIEPGSIPVIPPPTGLQSCVVIACSHITVRNIVAKHAANDGFNIHGDRVGIRIENVKAIANGDEGISAHETVQMDVCNAEIAWNGSSAGGVADVNDSVTSYTNCEVHHNLGAAFFFEGKYHSVKDCLIRHQTKAIVSRDDAIVETENVVVRSSNE